MNHQEAAAILGLILPTTPEAVKLAYRAKAKELHPDLGGSHEGMLRLNEAVEVLRQEGKASNPSAGVDWDSLRTLFNESEIAQMQAGDMTPAIRLLFGSLYVGATRRPYGRRWRRPKKRSYSQRYGFHRR